MPSQLRFVIPASRDAKKAAGGQRWFKGCWKANGYERLATQQQQIDAVPVNADA